MTVVKEIPNRYLPVNGTADVIDTVELLNSSKYGNGYMNCLNNIYRYIARLGKKDALLTELSKVDQYVLRLLSFVPDDVRDKEANRVLSKPEINHFKYTENSLNLIGAGEIPLTRIRLIQMQVILNLFSLSHNYNTLVYQGLQTYISQMTQIALELEGGEGTEEVSE